MKKDSETDGIPQCIERTFHIIDGLSAMYKECSTMITAIFCSDNSNALTKTHLTMFYDFSLFLGGSSRVAEGEGSVYYGSKSSV